MKKTNYEKALKRLEEIIFQLESKELSLEESLKLYREGIELYGFCNEKLNEAEEKVTMIIEEKGVFTEIPFEKEE